MNRTYVIVPNPIENAVEAVPYFTGQNIPLAYFIEECKEAQAMVPLELERNLVLMLRSKLRGEARGAIRGEVFETVNAFLSHLKELYELPKSLYQLKGEIGGIFQRDNESAVSYTNRARELGNQILDVIRSREPNNAPLTEAEILRYENEFRDCLIRGLKPEIEQKISRNRIFRETIIEAVKIERDLRARDLLRAKTLSGRDNNYLNQSLVYELRNSQNGKREEIVQRQLIVCQICNKPGHSALTCYQRNLSRDNNVNDRSPNSSIIDNNKNNNNNNYNNNNSRSNFNSSIFSRELANKNIDKKICYFCKLPGHFMVHCMKRRDNNRVSFTNRPSDPSTDGWARASDEENSGNYLGPDIETLKPATGRRHTTDGEGTVHGSEGSGKDCGNVVTMYDKSIVKKNNDRKNNNHGERTVGRVGNLFGNFYHGENSVGENYTFGNFTCGENTIEEDENFILGETSVGGNNNFENFTCGENTVEGDDKFENFIRSGNSVGGNNNFENFSCGENTVEEDDNFENFIRGGNSVGGNNNFENFSCGEKTVEEDDNFENFILGENSVRGNNNFENFTCGENTVEEDDNFENFIRGGNSVEKNDNCKIFTNDGNIVEEINLAENNNHGKGAVERAENLENDNFECFNCNKNNVGENDNFKKFSSNKNTAEKINKKLADFISGGCAVEIGDMNADHNYNHNDNEDKEIVRDFDKRNYAKGIVGMSNHCEKYNCGGNIIGINNNFEDFNNGKNTVGSNKNLDNFNRSESIVKKNFYLDNFSSDEDPVEKNNNLENSISSENSVGRNNNFELSNSSKNIVEKINVCMEGSCDKKNIVNSVSKGGVVRDSEENKIFDSGKATFDDFEEHNGISDCLGDDENSGSKKIIKNEDSDDCWPIFDNEGDCVKFEINVRYGYRGKKLCKMKNKQEKTNVNEFYTASVQLGNNYSKNIKVENLTTREKLRPNIVIQLLQQDHMNEKTKEVLKLVLNTFSLCFRGMGVLDYLDNMGIHMGSLKKLDLQRGCVIKSIKENISKIQTFKYAFLQRIHRNMKTTTWMVALLVNYLVINIDSSAVKIEQFNLKAGLYYESLGEVRFTQEEWKLVTRIDLNTIQLRRPTIQGMEIEEVYKECLGVIDAADCQIYIELDVYQRRSQEIEDHLQVLHQMLRPESVVTDKFVPDSSDNKELLDHYIKEFEVLEVAPWVSAHHLRNSTQIIRSDLDAVQIRLNNQISSQSNYRDPIRSFTGPIFKGNTTYFIYLEHLNAWSNITHSCFENYVSYLRTVTSTINSALLGQLSPSLLGFKTLRIATLDYAANNRKYLIPLRFREIYSGEIHGILRLTHDYYRLQLFLTLYIPLVQQDVYSLYKMNPYPVKQLIGDAFLGSAYIQPKEDYLLISKDKKLYSLWSQEALARCKVMKSLLICTPTSVIYDRSLQSSCETDLLIHSDSTSFKNCDIKVSKTHSAFWKPLEKIGGWLYSLPHPEQLQVMWETRTTESIKIFSAGILTLKSGCTARINDINLIGHYNAIQFTELNHQPNVTLNISKLLPGIINYKPLYYVTNTTYSFKPSVLTNNYGHLTYDFTLSSIKEELQEVKLINIEDIRISNPTIYGIILTTLIIIGCLCSLAFKLGFLCDREKHLVTNPRASYRKCKLEQGTSNQIQLVEGMNVVF